MGVDSGDAEDQMKAGGRPAVGGDSDTGAGKSEPSRRELILRATIECFGTMGYYGTSIQKIANEVGLTKAGVLHYVGSKEGLLELALAETYDRETDEISARYAGVDHPHLPAMLREVVAVNAGRPHLVQMFSTLSAEALNPEHPAHRYFAERERSSVESMYGIEWSVPRGVDVKDALVAAYCAMDGMQLRWLRAPGRDLNGMWALCEKVLFPSPLWDGYR